MNLLIWKSDLAFFNYKVSSLCAINMADEQQRSLEKMEEMESKYWKRQVLYPHEARPRNTEI